MAHNVLEDVLEVLACCLCETAVQLVTMATQWSLVTHANHASAMATAWTRLVESSATVSPASVCHVLTSLKVDTVNAVNVDITAPL